MEKRSLQSGNTFFPVMERRLTGSPAALAFWNSAMGRARRNEYLKISTKWSAKSFRMRRMQGIFCEIKHKPFFLIRRSLLIFIRTAPHQYSKGSFRLSLMQRPNIMSMNLKKRRN
jgi:hypothetical protein